MTPARGDLFAYRWVPFDETIPFIGIDFTGATFSMEVRAYRDAPGPGLITLTNSTGNSQGITMAPVTIVNGIPTSSLRIKINESTIEQLLPFPSSGVDPGESLVLAYDLIVQGSGIGKKRWLEGAFTIVPGATQV